MYVCVCINVRVNVCVGAFLVVSGVARALSNAQYSANSSRALGRKESGPVLALCRTTRRSRIRLYRTPGRG